MSQILLMQNIKLSFFSKIGLPNFWYHVWIKINVRILLLIWVMPPKYHLEFLTRKENIIYSPSCAFVITSKLLTVVHNNIITCSASALLRPHLWLCISAKLDFKSHNVFNTSESMAHTVVTPEPSLFYLVHSSHIL